MNSCPFSLPRLVKVSQSKQVVYKAEKASCRSFPDPGGDGLQAGPKRNYQILLPLEFPAEFTQHITANGSHLICATIAGTPTRSAGCGGRRHLLAGFGLILGNSSNRRLTVDLISRHQLQHAPEIMVQGRHGGPGP